MKTCRHFGNLRELDGNERIAAGVKHLTTPQKGCAHCRRPVFKYQNGSLEVEILRIVKQMVKLRDNTPSQRSLTLRAYKALIGELSEIERRALLLLLIHPAHRHGADRETRSRKFEGPLDYAFR